jgi:integrase/recombinase XerD
MSRSSSTALGRDLVSFFEDFLPAQRGLSPHTVRSYRDALLLFLRFTAAELRRTVDRLDIPDLTVERVTRFLASLEAERCNGIATRNARLGAIHVFARSLLRSAPSTSASSNASSACLSSAGRSRHRSGTWIARNSTGS